MSDTPPSSPTPDPDARQTTRPLVGGATIRELEQRDRELRDRAARAERLGVIRRVVVAVIVVAMGWMLFTTWRQLDSARMRADSNLQSIQLELDSQLTEALRYAPLHDQVEVKLRRRLDSARADLVSPDLAVRARSVPTVREFLALRMPRAKARVRQDLAPLYPEFAHRYRDSEAVIRKRVGGYNSAARDYNRVSTSFLASLIRTLAGYPKSLPSIK